MAANPRHDSCVHLIAPLRNHLQSRDRKRLKSAAKKKMKIAAPAPPNKPASHASPADKPTIVQPIQIKPPTMIAQTTATAALPSIARSGERDAAGPAQPEWRSLRKGDMSRCMVAPSQHRSKQRILAAAAYTMQRLHLHSALPLLFLVRHCLAYRASIYRSFTKYRYIKLFRFSQTSPYAFPDCDELNDSQPGPTPPRSRAGTLK